MLRDTTNNGVGCSVKASTESVPAHPLHRDKSDTLSSDEQGRHRRLMLAPPSQGSIVVKSTPTISQQSLHRHGDCEARDSERSNHALGSTPTPSSSRIAHATSSGLSALHCANRQKDRQGSADRATGLKTELVDDSPASTPKYRLRLLQQPTTGSAFGANLLSRTALAPPLILELQATSDGQSIEASAELPFLICQCSLVDEQGAAADLRREPAPTATLAPPSPAKSRKGRKSASTMEPPSTSTTPTTTESQLVRMLYGTLVAGPQMHKAPPGEEDVEKPYFFFPEISVRATGKFRIVCRLMRLPLPGISAIEEGVLASVETNTFEVVERANFMAPYITDVSRHFARQGVPLLLPPGVSAD